jgi:hypothetical protein
MGLVQSVQKEEASKTDTRTQPLPYPVSLVLESIVLVAVIMITTTVRFLYEDKALDKPWSNAE